LEDLADFACCNPVEVETALIELGRVLQIDKNGDRIHAAFPTRADEHTRRERFQREKEHKEQRRYYLYVIGKGGKVKIGISRQLVQRLAALRTSFPAEAEVLLTASGPYRAIRSAETRAHEVLKHCALGGEYFDASHARAVEVAKLALAHYGVTSDLTIGNADSLPKT
jgi:hypothetical protein